MARSSVHTLLAVSGAGSTSRWERIDLVDRNLILRRMRVIPNKDAHLHPNFFLLLEEMAKKKQNL